jgi:hypothetical protein
MIDINKTSEKSSDSEKGGKIFLRNIHKQLPNYTASYPGRQQFFFYVVTSVTTLCSHVECNECVLYVKFEVDASAYPSVLFTKRIPPAGPNALRRVINLSRKEKNKILAKRKVLSRNETGRPHFTSGRKLSSEYFKISLSGRS